MPTAGEAKLRTCRSVNGSEASVPKNVRSRSKSGGAAPQTGRAGCKSTKSSSSIPRPVDNKSSSAIPRPADSSKSTSSIRAPGSASRVRPAPDFSRLHQRWQQQFQKGKASSKKPCTLPQGFGITSSGTKIQQATVDNVDRDASVGNTSSEHSIPTNTTNRPPLAARDRGLLRKTGSSNLRQPQPEFSQLAQEQSQAGLEFERDAGALASILDETGVSMETVCAPHPSNASFKTPSSYKLHEPGQRAPAMEVRSSIYYKPDSRPRSQIYSDYVQRFVSRLTMDTVQSYRGQPPENKTTEKAQQASPFTAGLATVRKHGSIYVQRVASQAGSHPRPSSRPSRAAADSCAQSPAFRVPVDFPTKSPCHKAGRTVRESVSKSPAVRVQAAKSPGIRNSKDPMAKQLKFLDEEAAGVTTGTELGGQADELKELEEVERRLEEELLQAALAKQAGRGTPQQRGCDSRTPAAMRTSHLLLGGGSDKTLRQRASQIGQMVAEDIIRALPGCGSELAPLAEEASPAGDQEDLGQSPAFRKQKDATGARNGDSPTRPASKNPQSKIFADEMDVVSPRRRIKERLDSDKENSPRSPNHKLRGSRTQILQELSPNVKGRGCLSSSKKSVRFRDQSPSPVKFLLVNGAELDQENLSPYDTVSPSTKGYLGLYTSPDSSLLGGKLDITATIEDINQSLSESFAQYVELQNQVEDTGMALEDNTILKKLERVRQEQERLHKLQLSLQKHLAKQGKVKQSPSEKNRKKQRCLDLKDRNSPKQSPLAQDTPPSPLSNLSLRMQRSRCLRDGDSPRQSPLAKESPQSPLSDSRLHRRQSGHLGDRDSPRQSPLAKESPRSQSDSGLHRQHSGHLREGDSPRHSPLVHNTTRCSPTSCTQPRRLSSGPAKVVKRNSPQQAGPATQPGLASRGHQDIPRTAGDDSTAAAGILRTPSKSSSASSFSQHACRSPGLHRPRHGHSFSSIMSTAGDTVRQHGRMVSTASPISSPGKPGTHHVLQRHRGCVDVGVVPAMRGEGETGSLSLLACVASCQNELPLRPASRSHLMAPRYTEAMLNDEVAMYSRQLLGDSGLATGVVGRSSNPLAHLLQHGDDWHIIPVQITPPRRLSSVATSPVYQPLQGSAFNKVLLLH